MEIALYIAGGVSIILCLWLNVLATVAIRYDKTLESFQVKAQTVVVWLVPVFGAAFILHLVWQQYPDAIPKSWIPWPFKRLIFGKKMTRNRNRDDNEGPGCDGYLGARSRRDSDHGDSDGGGGGD